MGKKLQIFNLIFVSLIVLTFLVFIGITFLSVLYSPFAISALKLSLSYSSFWLQLLFGISSFFYLYFIIRSFSKCNLNNNYFKTSAILNICLILIAILSFIAFPITITLSGNQNSLGAFYNLQILSLVTKTLEYLLYSVSFIVFIIGYSKNKK
ncbi:hypothetical protein HYV88_05560 [Candidatus Woesearchaeota archaeon]|nr:hypothetical protein [Candidatus Woesearchaeota archaeon]